MHTTNINSFVKRRGDPSRFEDHLWSSKVAEQLASMVANQQAAVCSMEHGRFSMAKYGTNHGKIMAKDGKNLGHFQVQSWRLIAAWLISDVCLVSTRCPSNFQAVQWFPLQLCNSHHQPEKIFSLALSHCHWRLHEAWARCMAFGFHCHAGQ